MAEQLTLTVVETKPVNTYYRVARLDLNWREAIIHIELTGTNGERKGHTYDGQTATSLMVVLNTANLSVKSLHRRVLERLVADGVILGSVTGTPD